VADVSDIVLDRTPVERFKVDVKMYEVHPVQKPSNLNIVGRTGSRSDTTIYRKFVGCRGRPQKT
jgi:hypothetical protein